MFKRFQSSNLVYYYFLFLIPFILLYPKFPLLTVTGTYVAVRVEDLLIGLLIFIWLIRYRFKIFRIFNSHIGKAFLLFWFVGLLSLISAIFITYSVKPHIGLLHWLRRIEFMSLFFIGATIIKSDAQLKNYLKVIFWTTVIIVLYGFGQVYLDLPVVSTTNSEFSKGQVLNLTPGARANSTFAGHYDLAVYLSLVVIFLASIFFILKKFWDKFVVVCSLVFSFGLLGLTAARVSFVSAILGLVVMLWLREQKLLIGLVIVASLAAIVAIPELRHRLVATITVNIFGGGGPKYNPEPNSVNIFTPDNQASASARDLVIREFAESSQSATASGKSATVSADIAPGEPINTTELGVYRSFNIRTDVEWPRALRGFYKNPVLGTGYSSITLATDNDYLRSLGEVGILGTVSFGLIFLIIFKRLHQVLKKPADFVGTFNGAVFCSLVVVFITAIFIDVFEASKIATVIWSTLGIFWAVSNGYNDELG